MQKRRLVALNGNGGAFTDILATIPCRRVEIREDEAAAPTGLIFQTMEDNFVGTYTVGAPTSPDPQIRLGNAIPQGSGSGPMLGYPPQTIGGKVVAADKLLSLKGKAAGATSVWVIEYS
jgi:hypothetical protein